MHADIQDMMEGIDRSRFLAVVEVQHQKGQCEYNDVSPRRCGCGATATFERLRDHPHPATLPPEEAIECGRTGLLLRIRHRYPDAAEITSRMEALPERN